MLALRIILLAMILLVIPVVVGSVFSGVDKQTKKLPAMWINGQILLWTGFYIITVPLVLAEVSFSKVVLLFTGYMSMLVLAAIVLFVFRKKGERISPVTEIVPQNGKKKSYILWAFFGVVLFAQLLASVVLAYADGDDAFYVATATITESSDTMYRILPYTGGTTGLSARYSLAPFPIWIAYLARVTGIRPVMVSHVFMPLFSITMTYGVFYLLGSRLFKKQKERIPLFLIFVEMLVLFGDYSMYTPERFLIARSRQGKATLSAIIIPFLFYLLLLLVERMEAKRRMTVAYWGLLGCGLICACLCSPLGAVLACVLTGVTGVCAAVCYRKWKILLPLALCCVPCVAVFLLYLKY